MMLLHHYSHFQRNGARCAPPPSRIDRLLTVAPASLPQVTRIIQQGRCTLVTTMQVTAAVPALLVDVRAHKLGLAGPPVAIQTDSPR